MGLERDRERARSATSAANVAGNRAKATGLKLRAIAERIFGDKCSIVAEMPKTRDFRRVLLAGVLCSATLVHASPTGPPATRAGSGAPPAAPAGTGFRASTAPGAVLHALDPARELVAALAALAALGMLSLLWVRGLRSAVRSRTAELHRQMQLVELEHERLHMLIEANPDGMWLKDTNGVYVECNARALQYSGRTREQVLGRSAHDLFAAPIAERIAASDLQALRGAGPSRSEQTLVDASGATRALEVLKIPLPAPGGGFAGVLGVARDITEHRRMERALRLWAEAFHNARFGLSISDARSNRFVDVNPAFAAQRGYTRAELVGQPVTVAVPTELRERYLSDKAAADRGKHAVLESEALTRDGRRFPVLLDVTVVHSPAGEAEQRIVYSMDISEHKRAEEEMRIAAVAFESQEGILVTDADGVIRRVNSAFSRITGLHAADALDQRPSLLRSARHGRRFYARLQRALRLRGYWSGEMWIGCADQREILARVSISAVRDEAGAIRHYVCTMTDTTLERDAQRKAERLARYDSLTELPNRPHLRELVVNAIALSARSGELVALIMVDLDHFALVNGAHGHQRGDLVLVALARRMRQALRPGDVLGRFSGDKFVVLMEGLGSEPSYALHRASLMAEQLRGTASEPFELPDAHVPGVALSIGLSLYGPDIGAAADGDVLLAQAEAALRRAKDAGRDTVRVFEPQMQAEMEARAHLVEELRAGIAQRQLLLHLQPQFSGDGRLVGAEALVRWAHPARGLLYPDTFIGLAEDSGMIDAVGRQVLRMACEQLAAWARDPLLRSLRLSVNVSPLQFRRGDFVADVLDAVAAAGIEPDRLELELTESMILHDLDEAMSRLKRLEQHGILVSLDDFGTGASSLSYLTRLALHQLKIDKSFVRKLPDSRSDALVAQTIIMMAKGLGLEVVAEGVETEAQRDFLAQHGCDLYQGYLLGRPVPVEQFLRQAAAPA